jgi:hypothetical protein
VTSTGFYSLWGEFRVDSSNIVALCRMYVAQMKAKATRAKQAKQAKREAIEDKSIRSCLGGNLRRRC